MGKEVYETREISSSKSKRKVLPQSLQDLARLNISKLGKHQPPSPLLCMRPGRFKLQTLVSHRHEMEEAQKALHQTPHDPLRMAIEATARLKYRNTLHQEELFARQKSRQLWLAAGGLVDFSEAFGVLSNDIICSVVFGRKFSREEGENYFHLMLAAFLDLLGTFSVGEFIPSLAWVSRLNGLNARVKRNNEEFDAFFDRVLDEHIESRRDGGEGGNFLDVLLALQNDVIFPAVENAQFSNGGASFERRQLLDAVPHFEPCNISGVAARGPRLGTV
ncbi:Cytochrome P450 71A1 [Acorus calamus]|uniref:Cytochrome P450 71A1 n=1 Tax=Acorus calamus TaxID=4465 RepID=A0AAV9EZU8_ACOCL|nr:Cytochrome P450 71A1 [Acorus calamus]